MLDRRTFLFGLPLLGLLKPRPTTRQSPLEIVTSLRVRLRPDVRRVRKGQHLAYMPLDGTMYDVVPTFVPAARDGIALQDAKGGDRLWMEIDA